MIKSLLLCLLTIQSLWALHPDDFKWEIDKDRRGIKVFKAPRHEETGIIPIKAQTVLDFPISRVLTVLADTKRKAEWIPKLDEAYIIEEKSKYSRIEYARYSAPWPFHDRSFVISTKGRYDPKERTIFIDIQSTTHDKAPLNPKYVRGKTYIGSVFLKYVEENKTFFEITLLTDFRGNIPAWIINLVQSSWPFKMVDNLTAQLKKDDIVIPEFYKSPE